MKELELAQQNLIFKCLSGSKAYSTESAQSDTDIRGIFIAPPEYTIGCMKSIEQVQVPGEDTVYYELGKFIKLAAECNPNIIELLFTEDKNILFIDSAFKKLRDHRYLFLSKKAKFTFSGYAMAQMKRIKGHNKWINNSQNEKVPDILDFAKVISRSGNEINGNILDQLIDVFLVKVNNTVFRIYSADNFAKSPLDENRQNIQYVDKDNKKLDEILTQVDTRFYGTLVIQQDTYRIQHKMWKDYWQWKKNRNEDRSKLEAQYGFDCKHAMHLIRLLRMGREILRDGKVIVRRPDAEELLAIRNGELSYDELIKMAERLNEELDELYEKSSLPHSVNKEEINKLHIDTVQNYWRNNKVV